MLNKKKNNKGFTLVELLVVIAIIGILAVVAVPALFKNIEKGKVAELESDISAIRSAALSFYAENSRYPGVTDLLAGTSSDDNTTDANDIKNEIESLGNPFKGVYFISGKEPGKALLTINLEDAGAVKLSEDAAKKLVNDLGKVLIVKADNKIYTKSGKVTDEINGTVASDAADGDLDDITGDASKVVIELMDGQN
ncbi:type IV pilin protein [Romboutsia ilealis]|uniref:type IV pilin protein n=1 Tax=Romboutsia ilealis TaxID=1115758 RepID=UPI0024954887|nr:prepilin-type N-terminal cleavage/methylation domain-containing protein [Romboutsia ilealis]